MLTGFTDLDNCIGGFQDGELIVLGGLPKMGKTTLAFDIAEKCGKPVLAISLDPHADTWQRFCQGMISDFNIRVVEYYNALFETVAPAFDSSKRIQAQSFGEMAKVRELVLPHVDAVDIVIVDCIQFIVSKKPLEALKRLAEEINKPILVLSQVKGQYKSWGDHWPKMQELQDIDDEQIAYADKILLLYREDYYKDTTAHVLQVSVLEAPHWRKKSVYLSYSQTCGKMRFEDFAPQPAPDLDEAEFADIFKHDVCVDSTYHSKGGEDRFAWEFARGLHNLIGGPCKDREHREKSIARFKELSIMYGSDVYLTEAYAKGLSKILDSLCLEEAEYAIAWIQAAYERNRRNNAIALAYARGLCALTQKQFVTVNNDSWKESLARLEQLAAAHPDDDKFNYIVSCALDIDFTPKGFAKLLRQRADNETMAKVIVGGLAFLLFPSVSFTVLLKIKRRIEQIYAKYPFNLDIAHEFGVALYYFATTPETQSTDRTKAIEALNTLAEKHPDDGVIDLCIDLCVKELDCMEGNLVTVSADGRAYPMVDSAATRCDNAQVKRVELHALTKMSTDSVVSANDLVKRAAEWGHKAIAITDSGVVHVLPEAYETAQNEGIKIIYGVTVNILKDFNLGGEHYAAVLLAKNLVGLKNIYKLVSISHLEYFDEIPLIPKSVLTEHREGILVGSPWELGEVYFANYGTEENKLAEIINFYDYIEVAPRAESQFRMEKQGSISLDSTDHYAPAYKRRIAIAKKLNKFVVATGGVRFLDPKDELKMRILCSECQCYEDEAPPLFFRTTEEMLTEFAYLGEEKAYEVVVTNTNRIADMIEEFRPIPEGTFLPHIDSAATKMTTICMARAAEIYGDDLPIDVKERLDYELDSITKNGYTAAYMIAQKAVQTSAQNGYGACLRGCVGASLVAFLLGIVETNPMTYNIPFETFAGIDGDKTPDIDLDVRTGGWGDIYGEIQESFGADKVFRAGVLVETDKGAAIETVYNFFADSDNVPSLIEMDVLSAAIAGDLATTISHPSRLFILPVDKDIYDFTPIQYPESNKDSGFTITHFENQYLYQHLLTFDIIENDALVIIDCLENLTGVDARTILFDDEKTLQLLTSTQNLGVPVFEQKRALDIIHTTKPKHFNDFVQIYGLANGTGVWLDNAKDLITSGTATLAEVIAHRDDIMLYLMQRGVCRKMAFRLMEDIRFGRGISEEDQDVLHTFGIPEWYIKSCEQIDYLFPKAHAVSYTMLALRIAWFKAHHLNAFYQAYFSTGQWNSEIDIMSLDLEGTEQWIGEIESKGDAVLREDGAILALLQLRREMLCS